LRYALLTRVILSSSTTRAVVAHLLLRLRFMSDLEKHRDALEARLRSLEEQMLDVPEDSRARYLLQIDHATLMTELVQLRIADLRGRLAANQTSQCRSARV